MNRAVLVLVTGLSVMVLKPASAQQAVGTAPVARVSPAPASSSRAGPRLPAEYHSFEASVSDSSTAARVSTVNYSGGGVTITFSTLALVLVVVIVVLLVAR